MKTVIDHYLAKSQTPQGAIFALDIEQGATNTDVVMYGLDYIQSKGKTAVLYGYKNFLMSNLDLQAIANKYPLWLAQYPNYEVTPEPNYNYFPSFDNVQLFQFTASQALGFGFRTGFLGLLHMDVVQERLEREFDMELITTAPSVTYHAYTTDGEMVEVANPSELPEASAIKWIEEPYVHAQIMVPNEYVGAVMELAQQKRGEFDTMDYLDQNRVNVKYYIPLSEIIFDFFDKLKSNTRGYASLDYEISGYRKSDLVKIDILLNGDKVDALSFIVHKDFAQERSRIITAKLKQIIPRRNFEIPVQAAIGSKIVSRSTIKAYRKDVTSKIHTGDPDRRAKLLDKQKRGKKRMKAVGTVDVPQEAFMAVLKAEDDTEFAKGANH